MRGRIMGFVSKKAIPIRLSSRLTAKIDVDCFCNARAGASWHRSKNCPHMRNRSRYGFVFLLANSEIRFALLRLFHMKKAGRQYARPA